MMDVTKIMQARMELVHNLASKQEGARRFFEEKVIICPVKTCYGTLELKLSVGTTSRNVLEYTQLTQNKQALHLLLLLGCVIKSSIRCVPSIWIDDSLA
jgi:hypothetical protein